VRINGAAYEVIAYLSTTGLFLGPGVDIFVIIPLSSLRSSYPEAKELIWHLTVPREGQRRKTAHGEVIQALRRLRRIACWEREKYSS